MGGERQILHTRIYDYNRFLKQFVIVVGVVVAIIIVFVVDCGVVAIVLQPIHCRYAAFTFRLLMDITGELQHCLVATLETKPKFTREFVSK